MDVRDRELLEQVLESARLAIAHVASGGPEWRADQKTVDAAAKRVEQVGELLKRVSLELQAVMPEVPWREAKGIREILAHAYQDVDVVILAEVVKDDLPSLIAAFEQRLRSG